MFRLDLPFEWYYFGGMYLFRELPTFPHIYMGSWRTGQEHHPALPCVYMERLRHKSEQNILLDREDDRHQQTREMALFKSDTALRVGAGVEVEAGQCRSALDLPYGCTETESAKLSAFSNFYIFPENKGALTPQSTQYNIYTFIVPKLLSCTKI